MPSVSPPHAITVAIDGSAVGHPLDERPDVGATHLERVEHLGAKRRLGLGGGDEQESLGQLRVALCAGSRRRRWSSRGSARTSTARGTARRRPPGLEARGASPGWRLADRRARPRRPRARTRRATRRPPAGGELRARRPPSRWRAPPLAVSSVANHSLVGVAARGDRGAEGGDPAADEREHDGPARRPADRHGVGVQRRRGEQRPGEREREAGDVVGPRAPQEARSSATATTSAQSSARMALGALDHAELEAPRAQRPLGPPEEDRRRRRDGDPEPRARVLDHPGDRGSVRAEAREDRRPPDDARAGRC